MEIVPRNKRGGGLASHSPQAGREDPERQVYQDGRNGPGVVAVHAPGRRS